ncbi:LuxR C-terminal-related transcriptional regulator [Qipengyuania sp. JC766]|uniref:response regulator transcription factor n=1 Tax=Qipengyuania sp. JC766 TaxID=3232139 RepID=UPI00345A6E77
MGQRITIHFIEPSHRLRAELARVALDHGYHAEVYSSVDELVQSPLSGGIIVARHDPDLGGIGMVVDQLAEQGVWLPVIAMSEDARTRTAVAAVREGALDYLRLPVDPSRFRDTLARVGSEAIEVGQVRRRMIEARNRIASLSEREREVLTWMSKGRSNKAIAQELAISPRTVEIHRANMMAKLGAKHSAEAVRLSFEAEIAMRPWQTVSWRAN